jgi:hypothetical protein
MKFHFSIIGHGEGDTEVEFVECLQYMMAEYNRRLTTPKFNGDDKQYEESAYVFLNPNPEYNRYSVEYNSVGYTGLTNETDEEIRERHLKDVKEMSKHLKSTKFNSYQVLVREDCIED